MSKNHAYISEVWMGWLRDKLYLFPTSLKEKLYAQVQKNVYSQIFTLAFLSEDSITSKTTDPTLKR